MDTDVQMQPHSGTTAYSQQHSNNEYAFYLIVCGITCHMPHSAKILRHCQCWICCRKSRQ